MPKFVHTLTPHESYDLTTKDTYEIKRIAAASFVLGVTESEEDGLHLWGSIDNVNYFLMYDGFTATKFVESSSFALDEVKYIYASPADFTPAVAGVSTLTLLEAGDDYAGASVLKLLLEE